MIDTGADRDVISDRLVKRLDIHVDLTVLRVVTVENLHRTSLGLVSSGIVGR